MMAVKQLRTPVGFNPDPLQTPGDMVANHWIEARQLAERYNINPNPTRVVPIQASGEIDQLALFATPAVPRRVPSQFELDQVDAFLDQRLQFLRGL